MKKSLLFSATALLLFLMSGCGNKQAQVKASEIKHGKIDVDNVTYFCVDGVRYIKYDDDEQFGVTVKFNRDGSVDTNCQTEKK
jgi:outer membrane protein assembly factor BamE (lipoprotein component of BamABCDE complex)